MHVSSETYHSLFPPLGGIIDHLGVAAAKVTLAYRLEVSRHMSRMQGWGNLLLDGEVEAGMYNQIWRGGESLAAPFSFLERSMLGFCTHQVLDAWLHLLVIAFSVLKFASPCEPKFYEKTVRCEKGTQNYFSQTEYTIDSCPMRAGFSTVSIFGPPW